MDIKDLNETLEKLLLDENAAAQISDMEVRNEDTTNQYGVVINEKYPHFHWTYNSKVHFKFANRCPKTKAELKSLVASDEEAKLLSSKDYKDILKDLKKTVKDEAGKDILVFDALKNMWTHLHPNRDVNQDLIIL